MRQGHVDERDLRRLHHGLPRQLRAFVENRGGVGEEAPQELFRRHAVGGVNRAGDEGDCEEKL